MSLNAGIVLVSLGLLLAVFSSILSSRVRIPAPAFFLVGAAILSDVFPVLEQISIELVQNIVTVTLALILFDGGMHIGWRRFRANAGAILWLGIAGTLITAAALAVLIHYAFGFEWLLALALATALSPTDPAVVFSVLGKREIAGRAGTLLEGESGANDPVGISLMIALLAATTSGGFAAIEEGAVTFALQLGLGAAIGIVGGLALRWVVKNVRLPTEGLYPIRTLAGAGLIFGVAALADGSGFLAVFVAGIILGDELAPFKREVARFHTALASLGEIIAFTLLGLTVSISSMSTDNVWVIGLIIAVVLTLLIRPLLVGLVLLPIRLRRNERAFVLWSGLKGAVPVLLGTYILTSDLSQGRRAYDIIVIVVAFSVVVQGGLVPAVAARLRVPMVEVEQEPWSTGVRFTTPPKGLLQFTVAPGSAADGRLIADLPLGDDAWISMVTRNGELRLIRKTTELKADDAVVVIAASSAESELGLIFGASATT